MIHVVYHDDLDGRCAAAIVCQAFVRDRQIPVQCKPLTYGQDGSLPNLANGDELWMLDVALDAGAIDKLAEMGVRVTWIDHHAQSIDVAAAWYDRHPGERIRGVRDIADAACTLTWKFIYWWTEDRGLGEQRPNAEISPARVPRAVRLVADGDLFHFAEGADTQYLRAGAQTQDTAPESEFWRNVMQFPDHPEQGLRATLERGRHVHEYAMRMAREEVKRKSIGVRFLGRRCLALNTRSSSLCFGEDPTQEGAPSPKEDFDLLIAFQAVQLKWVVTLYSAKEDVSKIAVEYGGGGHQGAAGFVCDGVGIVPGPDGRPMFVVSKDGKVTGAPRIVPAVGVVLPMGEQNRPRRGPPGKPHRG